MVDAAIVFARGARDTLLIDEDAIRLLAPSGGSFEAEAAMGHGWITKGHGNATVISNAFVVSLARSALGERFARRGATSTIREAGIVAAVLLFGCGRASVANAGSATV